MRQGSILFSIPFICLLVLGFQAPLSAQKASEQLVVSGTILHQSKTIPDYKAFLVALKTTWKLKIDSVNISDKTVIFNAPGATVMIAYLEYPVAPDELGAAARLSWIWKTAAEECSKHQSQVVVSVIGSASKSLELHKIFSQTAAALLETTKAPGIYMDGQYLLLSNGYYTAAVRNMIQNQSIPVYCWVYFGRPGGGNSFTYGLSEFGVPEMEISNSTNSEGEVHAALYDATASVIKYNTKLQDGQTLTTEEGLKAVVHLVKGTYLEDKKVLKLDF